MKVLLYILSFLILSCSQPQKHELSDPGIIEALKSNDQKLKAPQQGEWRYEHNEPGQNLGQYEASKPISPTQGQDKIYLLPLGKFSDLQNNIIRHTADYLQIFFGLKTIIGEPVSDSIIPEDYRRTGDDGSTQLLTTYILDSILKQQIPKDAIVVMAITEKDLYPAPSWRFVFGQGSLKERVGVSSIYRYSTKPLDPSNYSLCLQRLIKTASHEIGHMFSMLHCTNAICVMDGSNSLEESDRKPNRLCSECLSKLHWNLKVDIRKRLRGLDSFFLSHSLDRDHQLSQKDIEVIK